MDLLKVSSFIDNAIQNQVIPGAVVSCVTDEEIIYLYASGYAHLGQKIEMAENTIFDLASLTKVVATLPSILQLVEQGKMDLDDPTYLYIPEFKEHHRDLRIKHLLTHTSGFPPEIKFYLKDCSREDAIKLMSQLKKTEKVGTAVIYSDLNFIILGYIVEQVTGMSLATYTSENIYQPIGMNHTFYNPPRSKINRIAATEFIESIGDYQWGKVHDENANHFGGISGHAGLFSTVEDLSIFARMILKGGVYHHKQILSKRSIDISIKNQTPNLNSNRGIRVANV